MLLLLALPLLTQLFDNVVGDNSNGYQDCDNTSHLQGFWNLEIPFGQPIVGIYKENSGYKTLKNRLPHILTKTIDWLSENSEEIIQRYGADASEDLQNVTENINRLKSEIELNQQLTTLPLAYNKFDRDAEMWNNYLELRRELEGPNLSWYFTKFLLSECYFFRRITQTLALTKALKTFDPFEKEKQNVFTNSINSITLLARHTMLTLNKTMRDSTESQKRELAQFLKLSLWGNRFDLSRSSGEKVSSVGDPVDLLNSFEEDLLIDDTGVVWDILKSPNRTNDFTIVDIVLDNAGYELFADLCLASFLVTHHLAWKVRFHVKQIPWYVSDVNVHDFNWVIESMRNSSDPDLKHFGDLCALHLERGNWSIEVDAFWTTFHDYGQMKKAAPSLYKKLSESTLVIFKGDLNYRKLLGDINWDHTTTLDAVLYRTDFIPSSVVALRTVKAHICVGLSLDNVRLWKRDEKLIDSGKFGVIDATVYDPCICATIQ